MHELEDHDRGLEFDLEQLAGATSRRRVLGGLVGAGFFAGLIGCGSSGSSSGTTSSSSSSSSSGGESPSSECGAIPNETAGPYPGDGSNGPNALALSGIVRSDLRSSFSGLTGTAAGIPLTVILTLTNSNANCAALPGYAVYLWHCDSGGLYSMYDLTSQNYLRGVQAADSVGQLAFTTVFPGCYAGRWPHIHFEVFPSLELAGSASNRVRTSQIALTTNACNDVYSSSGYESSLTNFSRVSLSTDNVFSDGYDLQIPEMTGDLSSGYTLRLNVGIPV